MSRSHLPRSAALITALLTTSACASTSYVPSTTPLAKLVDRGTEADLHVGPRRAAVSPFGREYIDLLHEKARPAAEKSRRNLRGAVFTHIPAAAAGIAAIVVASTNWRRAGDLDAPQGRATLGLTIGSALVGAVGTHLALRARAKLDEAVATHNDAIFEGLATPALEPPAAAASAPEGAVR